MNKHRPYIIISDASETRCGNIIRSIACFLATLRSSQELPGSSRVIPDFTLRKPSSSGYHAPYYPPNMKPMEPAPVHRGHASWNHAMIVRTVVQHRMDSF